MTKQYDFQQSKVYKFDSLTKLEYCDHVRLDWTATQAFVLDICQLNTWHIIEQIKIADGRRCRYGGGGIRNGVAYIQLPKYHRTKTIICHEMAHVLIWSMFNADIRPAGHGPEFMQVYCDLLIQFNNCDMPTLINLANEAGAIISDNLKSIYDEVKDA